MRPAGRRTESVAKHFLAFLNSDGGIHGAVSDTPPRLLEEIYGRPFQAAISESNLLGIMPCYCTINGEPVSASYGLLTGLLRKKMGFDGICFSDYGAVGNTHGSQHVGETLEEAGLMCLKAREWTLNCPSRKDTVSASVRCSGTAGRTSVCLTGR